ncbi:MAG: sulfite exporter TauE/SafE family protein [Sterolibacterium sp.]|jgi:uncharacterized membrane protein YfcA
MLLTLLIFLLIGGTAGFFAGLFGIGAGILMVPALHEIFLARQWSADIALRLALGTSMAAIVFSSVFSLRAHHRHRAVLWAVVIAITPGIVIGTLAGSLLANALPTHMLAMFFIAFLIFIAIQMALDLRPLPRRTLPGSLSLTAVGSGIGLVMSLIAGGGGVLSVPYLIWCNIDLKKAIGTAAAIGLPIALSGTLGYVMTGWSSPDLPDWSLGYLYLPALPAIVAASSVTAPLGANLAHRLPSRPLKRAFAALLLLVAARMIFKLIG